MDVGERLDGDARFAMGDLAEFFKQFFGVFEATA
jgi:hypothetical protein